MSLLWLPTNQHDHVGSLILAGLCLLSAISCSQSFMLTSLQQRSPTNLRFFTGSSAMSHHRHRHLPLLEFSIHEKQVKEMATALRVATTNSQTSDVPSESSEFMEHHETVADLFWTTYFRPNGDATAPFNKACLEFLEDSIQWEDSTTSTDILQGKDAVERQLRFWYESFASQRRCVMDKRAAGYIQGASSQRRVAFQFHWEDVHPDGTTTIRPNSRGMAWFITSTHTTSTLEKIQSVFWVQESSMKSGEAGLNLLSLVSPILEGGSQPKDSNNDMRSARRNHDDDSADVTLPERYFEAWNLRDMDSATSWFTENVTYDDTAFDLPFTGRVALLEHLNKCAKALPPSFRFAPEEVLVDDNNPYDIAVRWHVESNGKALPFTRGCSWYTLTNGPASSTPLIQSGIDFVEPPPGIGKVSNSVDRWSSVVTNKLRQEPIRYLPLTLWLAYVYVVFFSDGIVPGANALQLEPRTWIEVRDLSINFFFVSPLLHLPFSPTVHPILEAVFNGLLAWAALFAGFLSDDDRPNKPNVIPMLPVVVGMQLLTSAFFLPYLALRSNEPTVQNRELIFQEDLGQVGRVTESPWWGIVLGVVGIESILWGIWGRLSEFGDWTERWTSYLDLLSTDRVGSSFLVDLVVFALFQGWLIDDDWLRRQPNHQATSGNADAVLLAAKYVPFFGLAAYLTLRPPLPSKSK